MSKDSSFICLKQIAAMCRRSEVTAGRYSRLPGFPAPFYFNGRPLWKKAEVEQWIESCRRPRAARRA